MHLIAGHEFSATACHVPLDGTVTSRNKRVLWNRATPSQIKSKETCDPLIIKPSQTHRVSRQSSTWASAPALPGKGRWPAGGRAWSWRSRRLLSARPGAACRGTDRWPATQHRYTVWRWHHSGQKWGIIQRSNSVKARCTLLYSKMNAGNYSAYSKVSMYVCMLHKVPLFLELLHSGLFNPDLYHNQLVCIQDTNFCQVKTATLC